MTDGLCVAVLGASGAVGKEVLAVLGRSRLPVRELRALSSGRSAGAVLPFNTGTVVCEEVDESSFDGVDLAIFSAGADRSRQWAPVANKAGALVVDNSSAFRMEPDVPLIVPEVNLSAIRADAKIIANPNCCTAILVMGIEPLRCFGQIESLTVSTYQSASGGGQALMDDLLAQTKGAVTETPCDRGTRHPYAFNLYSHDTPITGDGSNEEEYKIRLETKKILGDPGLRVNVTCVRVPVLRAHSLSVAVQFKSAAPSVEQAKRALAGFPGVELTDEAASNLFPMPCLSEGRDPVAVGRIRIDPEDPSVMNLFVCGDQLLKGAALNAVQIAEAVLLRTPQSA